MAIIQPLWKSDPIQYILNWKFPQLAAFSIRTLADVSKTLQDRDISKEVEEYRRQLLSSSPEDFAASLEQAKAAETKRLVERLESEERQRSFNQPHSVLVDFDYWSTISFWTIDEAVSLSLKREPRHLSWKHIQSNASVSAFAAQYAARRELAMRAKVMGQLWESTTPAAFLAWAGRTNFSVPAELVAAVKGLGIQIADWKTLYDQANEVAQSAQALVKEKHSALMAAMADHSQSISTLTEGYNGLLAQRDELIGLKDNRIESLTAMLADMERTLSTPRQKPLGARERDSFLKLVIGMAIKGYSFDPKSGRSTTAKEISGDLALIGLAMDEDTVRKYLAEAKQLLPGDQTDRDR
ncbi:hypothetical protein [Mesorhizobium sp.]|uniref:hypothetical protein n=1 Tax=Mesorhizobium sp. TaxID=1871066 RepID=UPI000FE2F11E|nr:hypothetical protein [Mesorhizobium sp.]RWO00958.1 MAG: hypothetical protein EOS06_09845 [Mesorhizobium sp.]RWO83073.1 MAG: hypothetical protein EOS18_05580 [Mesorhizobium sp.]